MRTVIRKIKILAAVNGCYKTKGGYIKNNDFDINKAAEALGVSGVLEKRKKQHRQDRAIYKTWKERIKNV